jgi:vacuolar-type H+-ATPase subunit H
MGIGTAKSEVNLRVAPARRYRKERTDGVTHRQESDQQKVLQVAAAADRAGAIVSDHIRTLIEQAEANAEEIRSNAEREAETIKRRAVEAASRVIQRIESIDGPLAELVNEIQREADSLSAEFNR